MTDILTRLAAITANAEQESDRTRESTVEALAEILHRKMEHLDPTDQPEWGQMTDRQKSFYHSCVENLLLQEGLLRTNLAVKSEAALIALVQEAAGEIERLQNAVRVGRAHLDLGFKNAHQIMNSALNPQDPTS